MVFYVNFFVKFELKMYLFTYTDSAMISMGHIYARGVPEVCIIDIFMYIYGFCHHVKLRCFSGRRLTASMFSTIKQLNKILTAYD